MHRFHRLRQNEQLRRLMQETRLSVDSLIYPIFVQHGRGVRQEISSMPGQYRLSIDQLKSEIEEILEMGIGTVLLFGLPEYKDEIGSSAYDEQGIIQEAVRAIKRVAHQLVVITDVCLCEYTSHGHCGVIRDGQVDNDQTLELLAKTAVSQASAGADIVAPSAMMDGQVRAIREALDKAGFKDTPIMSYSAKYASALYAPFREAADSAPQFGDRKGYQLDVANLREAMREIEADISEGADIVMVKPALAYLDVIYSAKQRFDVPLAAYNVSGEYAMIKAAAQKGWLDEKKVVMELLTAIKRAGADIIITYFARDVARWLREG